MTEDISFKDGHLYGGWRQAVNVGIGDDNIGLLKIRWQHRGNGINGLHAM